MWTALAIPADVYKVADGYDQYWKDSLGNIYGGSWLTQPAINGTPLSEKES